MSVKPRPRRTPIARDPIDESSRCAMLLAPGRNSMAVVAATGTSAAGGFDLPAAKRRT